VPWRYSGGDAHVRERPVYERAQSDEGTLQHRTGRPGDPHLAAFDRSEGKRPCMNEIPQLVREKSQPLVQRLHAVVRRDGIALVGVFRDGFGDAVIETAVERSELVDFDGRLLLERQIGNGLAEIAIVVDHLLHGKSLLKQLAPV